MAEFRIETERLVLRDWRAEDWAPFLAHTNTPEVMRWLGGVMDAEKAEMQRARLYAYAADHGHTFWVVERLADGGHLAGEILGFCGLKLSNQPGGPLGEFEAGWRLRADAWGHGYAREAAEATLNAAFAHFAAPQVIALTVAGNTASWGLMERLGMRRRPDLDFDSADWDPDEGRVIVYSLK